MKKSVAVSSTITAGQDAPPTGLVLYGFPYNPTVEFLYKVELRVRMSPGHHRIFLMLPQVAASFAPGSTDKVIKSGIARGGQLFVMDF